MITWSKKSMERNSRKSLLLFAFNLLLCYPLQAQVSCWLSDSTNIVSLFDLKLDTVFSIFGEPDHIEREKVIQKFGKDTRGSDEALFYEKYKLAFLTRKHFEYAGYLETRHWIHKLYFEDCYVNSMVIQKGSPILVNNKKFKELKNQADLENLFKIGRAHV